MAEVWLGSRLIRACICAGIPLFCAATLLTHRVEGEVRVTMIDVGQGDGFYLKSPSGSHCMIDWGKYRRVIRGRLPDRTVFEVAVRRDVGLCVYLSWG